ncbi:MAG: TrkA family potassium uptake protein [Oscillospiraceae bacterium]|nr:TrkA family potassium uptake protein [Oscillospiraceae bacterium]
MNVLIIGCGKVGSRLADLLDSRGHDVAIIDANVDAFRALSDDFSGITVCGMAMDMRVLTRAGIEGCDAVAVVTQDDNLNITVSQIVKQFFGLENVLARISDPSREKVFKRFGLKTICPTKLAADTMYIALTQPWDEKSVTFESATVSFTCFSETERLVGKDASKLKMDGGTSVLGVLRENGSMELACYDKKLIIEAGDKLIISHISD